jgi:hypothetical protein
MDGAAPEVGAQAEALTVAGSSARITASLSSVATAQLATSTAIAATSRPTVSATVSPTLTAALKSAVLIPNRVRLPPAVCPPPVGARPDPTLVNTDPFVLSRFPLERVYEQLLSSVGAASPSAVSLYQQLWDSLDTTANAKFSGAAHCDANGGTINGFPIDCPRPETQLKNTTPAKFTPVALFNRFDLSPSDGSSCGEYRIIYAMNDSSSGGGNPYGGGGTVPRIPQPIPQPIPGPGPIEFESTVLSARIAPSIATNLTSITALRPTAINTAAISGAINIGTIGFPPPPPPPPPVAVNGRSFIIFEGMLPNPNPSCGVEMCRPVVQFWENLATLDPTTSAGQQALGDRLEQFYFSGIPGFEPVVHARHYGQAGGGGYGHSGGQIRTNMFVDFVNWQLREFHLVSDCSTGSCGLRLDPVTVKTNPFAEMFDSDNASPNAKAAAFRGEFPAQTHTLTNDVVTQISMSVDDQYNAGQSGSQDPGESYEFQFNLASPSNTFSAAINSQLLSPAIMRPDLTAADITRRATTQSCAGCHQLSNGAHLGGNTNPVWPNSLGFVHVDEHSNLSPALWCSFLPARKSTLDAFNGSASRSCPPVTGVLTAVQPTFIIDPQISVAQLPQIAPAALTVAGRALGPN